MQKEPTKYATSSDWHRERLLTLTSTEVSALWGLNPYKSLMQLWHEKRDGYKESVEVTNAIYWGNFLEDGIAKGIASNEGWQIHDRTPWEMFAYDDPSVRLSASYDRIITCPTRGVGLQEIKARSFYAYEANYNEAENLMPANSELQLQVEMMCSGLPWAVHCVFLLEKREYRLYFRRADTALHAAIAEKVKAFWASIAENDMPKIDYSVEADRDYLLGKLKTSTPKKIVDLTTNNELPALCSEYKNISGQIKLLEASKEACKVRILEVMGDAEKAMIGDGYVVRAATVNESLIESYVRKSYRGFRVDRKETA